jgi:hypothetical protein
MKSSPTISNLTKALLKAQSQMGSAVKGAKNPFFKSNYADLPTVMEVVKGPLNDNGLLVLQPNAFREGRSFIDTVIIHAETGEYLIGETEVICSKERDPQANGAAQTYARRFGLQAMIFIPSEDDDGNQAAGRGVPPKPAYTPKVAAPVESLVSGALTNTGLVHVESPLHTSLQTTVEPLKKSSFRKPKLETPVSAAPKASTAPASEDWS